MKVLVIGDIHAYPWGVFPLTASGANQYLEQVKDLLQVQAPAIIRQQGINLVVLLGDLADEPYRRGKIGVNTQNILLSSLRRLRDDTHTRIAVIAGNHDCYSTEASWLPALADVITFGAAGEPLLLPNDYVGGPPLCFVPYAKPEVVNHWLSLLPDDAVVFGHFAYQGASMGHGKVIGDEDAVPTDHLRRFRYSILGHIHMPADGDKHSYVGLPIPYSWASSKRGNLMVVDTMQKLILPERIPMAYPMFFGPNTTSELKVRFATVPPPPGSYLRVYWSGTVSACRESLLESGLFPPDIKVYPVPRDEFKPEDGKTSTPRSEITGSVVSAATTAVARADVLSAYLVAKKAVGIDVPCDDATLLAVGRECLGLDGGEDASGN